MTAPERDVGSFVVTFDHSDFWERLKLAYYLVFDRKIGVHCPLPLDLRMTQLSPDGRVLEYGPVLPPEECCDATEHG